jgi:GT2 family glycosyltransferase
MPPELAVITLSKTDERLGPLTESLDNQDGAPPFIRLLVNNGLSLYPAQFHSKWATLEMGFNSSFSAGNNAGVLAIRQAFPSVTHVLLLNDDCLLRTAAIGRLWAERHRGIVGTLLIEDEQTVNHAGARLWPRPQDHIGRGAPVADWYSYDCPIVQAVTFASVLISLEAWDTVGGFDEGYVYGFEDTDFCLKYVEAGGLIHCARSAVGQHGECGTRARFQDSPRDQANAQLFYGRWTEERVKQLYAGYPA